MVLHFHYSISSNSGEIRRIKNINKDIAFRLSDQVVEIEFYPLTSILHIMKEGKFKLSNKILRKFYFPMFPFRYKFLLIDLVNDWWTSFLLLIITLVYRPTHIIGEYSIAFKSMNMVSLFKNIKLIIDIHGALPEEYLYNNDAVNKKLLNKFERLENLGVMKSDYVICQSEEMKSHVMKKYGALGNKIVVYKCGVDINHFKIDLDKRVELRSQLSIDTDAVVFVYSGGMHKWQKVEESILLFKKYNEYNNKSKLLILTKDILELERLLVMPEIKTISNNIIVKSLSFNEISNYLNVADIAFLLRDNVTMNSVASPTKLAEYMACGLPIISTEVARKWISKEAYNYIIWLSNDCINTKIDVLLKKGIRDDIRNYCINNFSIEIDEKNVCDFFSIIK